MGKYDYKVTDIMCGVSTNHNKPAAEESPKVDTSIWSEADKKAQEQENKTAITIMLEDFAQLTNSFSGSVSCISEKNTKKAGFIEKIFMGVTNDNVYKSEAARDYIKETGAFTQKEIYAQEVAQNGGVKYAGDKDDVYESALNFAKADIVAIEKAYDMANPEESGKGKKLEAFEIDDYAAYSQFGNISETLEDIDLDGKAKYLSPEEYASYMIAIDGLISFGPNNENIGHAPTSVDGLISTDEVELASQLSTEELKAEAEKIYKEHFAD